MGKNKREIESILKKGARFICKNSNIIDGVEKTVLYNDEPKIFSYTSYYKDKFTETHTEDSVASGVAFNKTRALLKLIGETIERYALTINNNKNLLFDSFNNLNNSQKNILNPAEILPFSQKQIKAHNINISLLKSTKIHWILGKSLTANHEVLIPAQLIFVPYIYQKSEPLIMWPISTGAASGKSLDEALYKGICEIVERDSFMIHYLNKINSSQINISSIKNREINKILEILSRYKIELSLINLTTDIGIPSIGAVLLDKTGLGPAVCVGLKAGWDINDVIIGAIEEAVMLRTWIRDKFIYLEPDFKREKIMQTINDRAHFWFPIKAISYLDFWLNNKNKTGIKEITTKINVFYLQKAVSVLKEKKIDIYYVNLTDKLFKKTGFTIVKVIIPELQPLYLSEDYRYFGKRRLYQAPVNMEVLQKPKTELELNKIPHPFL